MSGTPSSTVKPLTVPHVDRVEFDRNLIRQVVCELRFPTLLEWETQPPISLQRALRKDYPHYEGKVDVELQPGAASSQRRHVLWSKKRTWAVSVRSFAISIETISYKNFEELLDRVEKVLKIAQPIIDSDFFTRVGLRYINVLNVTQGDVDGWLNPDLVAPLAKGVYGTVDQCWQEIRGRTEHGGYFFRHGYPLADQAASAEYLLDLDMYQESVEATQISPLLKSFHDDQFRLFMWSLGAKAKAYMGKATRKGHS